MTTATTAQTAYQPQKKRGFFSAMTRLFSAIESSAELIDHVAAAGARTAESAELSSLKLIDDAYKDLLEGRTADELKQNITNSRSLTAMLRG